ncbi:MAG: glycosyltransferase family 2 protein [Methylobacter sp.]
MKKTTVIIPTYNGKNKIINAIRGLEKQTLVPDEVIIVIDGSTDGTAEMLRSEKICLPKYKIIEQQNLGRAAVRNRGVAESTGDLLIFLDDDMTVPEHWLQAHYMHHEMRPNSLMSGRLESPPIQEYNDFIIYKAWLNNKWNNGIKPSANKWPLNYAYITSGNFSIEKNTFYQIGKFDDRLTDLEDYDFALRAKQMSYDIYVDNDAYAWHNDTGSPCCLKYIKRLREYLLAQEKLISLKPEIYLDKNTNIRLVNIPNKFKKVVYFIFAKLFWINSIDKCWLIWLPKFVRYKLYSAIIFSNSVIFPDRVSLR